MATVKHYQVRFVKRIENNGTIITFPRLGKMYELHNQKTLKSYHSLSETIKRAIEFNSDLPDVVQGMVIVSLKTGGLVLADGSKNAPHVKKPLRKVDTTEWLRFIDRKGSLYEVAYGTHVIGNQTNI